LSKNIRLEKITPPSKDNITGLILAGGQGSRFHNQDKGLIKFKGITLVEFVANRLKTQTSTIAISANRNLDFYQQHHFHTITDIIHGYSGPLAGIHAALKNLSSEWLVSIACDTPCFPENYVQQLTQAIANTQKRLAVVKSNNRLQNVSMLVHKSLFNSLDVFLDAGERKAQLWLQQQSPCIVEINQPQQAFFNINTPEDLLTLEKLDCND